MRQRQQQQQHLDDDEQFMFEQRLAHDELGVAIRKISHSGKAQLRYVKCVPVRPPSSSDYCCPDEAAGGGGGAGAGGGSGPGERWAAIPSAAGGDAAGNRDHDGGGSRQGGTMGPYLELHSRIINNDRGGGVVGVPPPSSAVGGGAGTGAKIPSDSVSVSSRSSTGSRRLLEMMRSGPGVMLRNGRLLHKPGIGGAGGGAGNVAGGTPPSAGSESLLAAVGGVGNRIRAADDDEDDDDRIDDSPSNLLLHDGSAGMMMIDMLADGGRSHRALTWGKKNAVVLSLDKFTCVRKGKTTDRTLRNSSPGSRLLSIMTNVRGNESLDIEAPTMLDRDKFASAFARFLGVPLVEEKDVVGGGGGRAGRSLESFGNAGKTGLNKMLPRRTF
jgi:hypothetical protein